MDGRTNRFHTAILCLALLASLAMAQEKEAEPAGVGGQMIKLATAYSTKFNAYVAGPANARLGVLLVHDRWGLDEPVRAWADRIAELGCRVVAVDLYDGRPLTRPSLGPEAWRQLDPVWIDADLDGALADLQRSQSRIVVGAWGEGIGPVGDLARRSGRSLSGLMLYYDDETRDQASHLPASLTMPVLDISVARSLAYPIHDPAADKATEEVWQATQQFLKRFE
jgi:hypothetical protein